MGPHRKPRIREEIVEAVLGAGRSGIYQKDLQKALGISKSYCSEQLSYLSDVTHTIARKLEGGLFRVYHIEYYPGPVRGVVRVGMLRSSEYVPAIMAFRRVFERPGSSLIFRFYNGTMELFQDFGSGTLEFMLAPTQATVLNVLISNNLKIMIGLGTGGSGIISQHAGKPAVLSTELSSMISLASEHSGIDLPGEIISYDDPLSAVEDYSSGKYSFIAIWEPYFTYLVEKSGNTVILEYSSVMGDMPCCCASVNKHFYDSEKAAVAEWAREYSDSGMSINEGSRLFVEAVELIASATGISSSVVRKSLGQYNFGHTRISIEKLRKAGINLSSRQVESLFLPDALAEQF